MLEDEDEVRSLVVKHVHCGWHQVILKDPDLGMPINVSIHLHKMTPPTIADAAPEHEPKAVLRP